MPNPKPYVVEAASAATNDAQPISLDLTQVAGYDVGETQTLKHVTGTLTWVTDAP